jgi:hypothetical protein
LPSQIEEKSHARNLVGSVQKGTGLQFLDFFKILAGASYRNRLLAEQRAFGCAAEQEGSGFLYTEVIKGAYTGDSDMPVKKGPRRDLARAFNGLKKHLQTVNSPTRRGTVSSLSVDAEDLIARLSGGLAPADCAAFRKAAETALVTSPKCSGEQHTFTSYRDESGRRRLSDGVICQPAPCQTAVAQTKILPSFMLSRPFERRRRWPTFLLIVNRRRQL